MIKRSREAGAFLATLDQAAPEAVSACEGWTTHEIAAHVTGAAVEVLRHLDPYLQGDPVPPTRGFKEREAPLQAMDHSALLHRLDAEEQRMRAVVGDILDREPDAVIPWTGRQMAVAKFIPHLRNEHALHRWDIAGDDDTSLILLADPDLVEHSVGVLGQILLAAGREHDPIPTPTSMYACAPKASRICGCWSRTAPPASPGPTTTETSRAWRSTPPPGNYSSGDAAPTATDDCTAT